MIPKEILRQVRRIEITTSRLVNNVFAGAYHSAFKGRGVEFDEVREYRAGDDIRTIDWNVTARTGVPHVKVFVEEREMTVMLLVDASRSGHFATAGELKNKLAAEIAAVLAFSAIRNNDKVGLIIFTDQVELFIPPRKGLSHVLRVIREVLYFEPQRQGTDIVQALDYLNKVTTRRSVAFVISDFFGSDSESGSAADRLKKALTVTNRRHDVVAITLNDRREVELPNCGVLTLQDAESGRRMLLDSSDPDVRRQFTDRARQRLKERTSLFRSAGIDHVDILTDRPYADEFVKFFAGRRRKFVLG